MESSDEKIDSRSGFFWPDREPKEYIFFDNTAFNGRNVKQALANNRFEYLENFIHRRMAGKEGGQFF